MRPARQIKIINSHIEGFENLRRQLEILLDDINDIIKRSESWLLENGECETFSKLNQVLDVEMESCLNRLTKIADENEDTIPINPAAKQDSQEKKSSSFEILDRIYDTQYNMCDKDASNVKETLQDIIDKMPTLEQAVESSNENYSTLNTKLIELSDKMSTLQEKLDLQDENIETKYNTRFNEILAEVQTASDSIQAKNESFSEKNKETEQKLNAELNVRCKNIEDQIEAVIKKLKGYNTELQTQTNIIAEIKQEKYFFSSKITELENKLLCITKTVENMSILHENVPHSNEKFAVHDESLFAKGCHETLMSEGGEADLQEHFNSCTKNPGHAGFTPVENFTIKQMPEGLCNNDLYEFVSVAAALTVIVDVNMTSPNRQVSDPFYDIGGSTNLRTGSGRVTYVKCNNGKYCECKKCLKSDTRSKQWCEFHVYTAAQVVYDDIEASRTSIRLFYDSETSPVVSVDDVNIFNVNVASDLCMLKCITCNKEVADKLSDLYTSFFVSWNSIEETYKDSRDIHKISLIVSHPHGCPKKSVLVVGSTDIS